MRGNFGYNGFFISGILVFHYPTWPNLNNFWGDAVLFLITSWNEALDVSVVE